MLDIKYLKENREELEKALLKRMAQKDLDLDALFLADEKRREIISLVEEKKAERNKSSKSKPDAETITAMKNLGEEISELDKKLVEAKNKFNELLSALPNIPDDDIVAGDKEANEVIYTFASKPEQNFKTKDHVELAESLGLIDYQRAVKLSGSGFWSYTGVGALLEWALLNYFVDFHNKNNYTFILPPLMLSAESAYASGHLPKFRDDLFWVEDGLCLNATAEMMLGNWHRAEILPISELPKKYFSYSPCFRREAGTYRKEERGMIRGHQFNKVEMFAYCLPEESPKIFDEFLENAQKLMEGLGLHFQTSKLAAGDMSAAMCRTYDIEVWIPSMGIYKEVSSVSNAGDYQARRGGMRFKRNNEAAPEFMHTVNGSGLATSRLIPAILEQNQNEDGSVNIPEALWPYLPNGIKKISLS